MQNILKIIVFILLVSACKKQKQNNFLTFSGKIENSTSDSIIIQKLYKQDKKVIKLSKDGTFKDTLTVVNSFYTVYIGNTYEKVYFKNGADIVMNVDLKNYNETLTFSGKGAKETNLVIKDNNARESLHKNGLMNLSEHDFKTKTNDYLSTFNILLEDKNLDSLFVVIQKATMNHRIKNITKEFQSVQYIKNNLNKGTESPKFINYTNHNESTTSLDDLKGKCVYIDFWDTYCPPCIREFPALEKLIEKYKNKKIEFVSISLNRPSELEEWKNFITTKKLKGTQLIISDRKFVEEYNVNSIPRYALIDPEGNIIDADTFKPSDPKLIELLNSLDL